MKARKLEWVEDGKFVETEGFPYVYWAHKERLYLNIGSQYLGNYDTLEAAKQAAQDHADKLVEDMIDPDYLLALTRFAMNEGYKNATCPTLVYTAEEVLQKFKQKP